MATLHFLCHTSDTNKRFTAVLLVRNNKHHVNFDHSTVKPHPHQRINPIFTIIDQPSTCWIGKSFMLSPDQPTPQPSTSQGNGEAGTSKPKEKTCHMFRPSFDYTIVSSNDLEAHEQRLKKLNEIAADLQKDEWMFTPVDKLLGNWTQ